MDDRLCTSCRFLTKVPDQRTQQNTWFCTEYKLHLSWVRRIFKDEHTFYKILDTKCPHRINKYEDDENEM